MRTLLGVFLAIALPLAACNDKSGAEQAREEQAREMAHAKPDDSPATTTGGGGAAPAAKPDAAPPAPEPTTPAEIDRARNQAMIDGKDKDVLKYCELGKIDDKSNPQAQLGCTLAGCRTKDETIARRYGKPLPKAYLEQAKKVCIQNGIAL